NCVSNFIYLAIEVFELLSSHESGQTDILPVSGCCPNLIISYKSCKKTTYQISAS
ncbi:unnamed protein product, partial [Larinioides sclopetarius]